MVISSSLSEQIVIGMKDAQKMKQKLTWQEEEKALLATAPGQAAWQANQAKAEELYRQALAREPANAKIYRGLGELLEKARQPQQAIEHYRKYLELQPNAEDRWRILNRIEALQK